MESSMMMSMAFNPVSDGLPIPQFVNFDTKYKCTKCARVLNQPRQLPCGHRICLPCVEELFPAQSDVSTCPSESGEEECSKEISRNEIYPDNSAQRELKKLPVYCLFKEFGCLQTMPWMHYKIHIEKCEFRLQRCQFCRSEIPLSNLEVHLSEECPSVIMECQYNCRMQNIVRSQMAAHLETCPMRPKPCDFQQFGCNFSAVQRELEIHLTDHVHHLKLLATRVQQLEGEVAHLKSMGAVRTSSAVVNTTESSDLSLREASGTTELDRIKNKLLDLERLVQQSSSARNTSRDSYDELAQINQKIRELEIVRASETALSHTKSLLERDEKIQELEKTVYELKTISHDGIFVWRICNFRRMLSAIREGRNPPSFYSQPFYTHQFGYKLCGRIYLNGDGTGRGTHVSLFIVVMQGEYDDALPWPFNSKITFVLIDQSGARNHLRESFHADPKSSSFQKPTSAVNVACGCPKLVSHDMLECATDNVDSSGRIFVQNDTIYFKLLVECTDMRN